MSRKHSELDAVGKWSEDKIQIVTKYAAAYSKILNNQPGLVPFYVDGFAGAGQHISKTTGQIIPGSAINVLNVTPPFGRYFLVDQDETRVKNLRQLAGSRDDVEVIAGDCNDVLTKTVFPQITQALRKRALCLLDPYGMHLKWEVMEMAGQLGTIDLLLNFPIMDMNMNALKTDPNHVLEREAARMSRFWGDESWKSISHRPKSQGNLFGDVEQEKSSGDDIAAAFCERLQRVAKFRYTASPVPMLNNSNGVIYYLVFASQKEVACKIMGDIFRKMSELSRHTGRPAS